MKRYTSAVVGFLIFSFSGCENPVSNFYAATPSGSANARRPYSGTSQIFGSTDQLRDGTDLLQRGYVLIGKSTFEGVGRVTNDMVMKKAKDVGAEIILYSSKYEGAEQRIVAYPKYVPGTTTTTYGTASVYSPYGTATVYGSSQSYTSGTFDTELVPVMAARYAHFASFWARGARKIFGAYASPLTNELKQTLQRNGGAVVRVVVDNSPAFRANVLPGDVIISVNDTEIASSDEFFEKCKALAGQSIKLTVLRSGAQKTIPVQLNPVSAE